MSPVLAVVLLVAAQRLVELVVARRNTARLLAQGAVEHGARHYPLIVLLHTAWLLTLPAVVPADRWPDPWLLGLFVLLQPLRAWVIASLGGLKRRTFLRHGRQSRHHAFRRKGDDHLCADAKL